MDGVTYKLGLDVSSLLSGTAKGLAAFRALGTGGVSALRGVHAGVKGIGDILFKLPSQIQAIQGGLSALSLPSKLAGSAETTSVAFGVLLGSSQKAKVVLGQIRDLAAETPFEFSELAGAARSLAAFGEKAEAIPAVLRRIGDVAAGTESSIAELAVIYGKARVAGTLYAEDINQLTERGIPVLQLFAAQMGVQVDQVKKLAAEGQVTFPMLEQAFQDLTNEGGQFAGMMGEISKTFEGKMSTLRDAFLTVLGEMGAGINEGLKPVLDELTAQLDGQQGLARQIGENIGMGIEAALNIIRDGQLIDFITAGLDLAGEKFGDLMEEAGRRLMLMVGKAARLMGQTLTGDTEGAAADMMKPAELQRREDEAYINQVDRSGTDEAQKRFDSITGGAMDKAKDRRRRDMWRGIMGGVAGAPGRVGSWMEGVNNRAKRDEQNKARRGFWGGIGSGINEAPGKIANWMGGLKPSAAQQADAMLGGLSGVAPDAAASPGPVDKGRPGGSRSLGKLGGLQMAYQQADQMKRGSWGDFVKNRMGMDYDKLDARGRAALLAAAPEGKATTRYGREAERRAASDRMKAAAAQMGQADPKDAAAMKTMSILEKYVPEIAKTLKEAVEN